MQCRILKTNTSRGGDFSGTFSCTAAKSIQLLPLCFAVTVSRGIWKPISPNITEQQRKKRLQQLYLTCFLLADRGRTHIGYKWLLFLILAAWTISVHSGVAVNLQHLQKHRAGFSILRCFQSSKPQLSRNVFSRDLLLYCSCILYKLLMKFKCYDIDLWNRNCFLCWTPVHRQSPWTLYLGIESSLLDSHPWERISHNSLYIKAHRKLSSDGRQHQETYPHWDISWEEEEVWLQHTVPSAFSTHLSNRWCPSLWDSCI